MSAKMVTIKTVTEAKAQLSALLEQVDQGEQVIISRSGKPVAALVPYSASCEPRKPGQLRDKIKIAPDFDETTPEILEMFENGAIQ